MSYTVDDLVVAVHEYATLPTFDEGADARLLRMLNREQLLWLTGVIQGAAENYRTTQLEIPVVTGQLAYDIPSRAIASGLKMIQATDTSGNIWLMTELRPEDIPWMRQQWVSPCRQFYLYRNQIVFYGQPPAGTITVTYPLRLNQLVVVGACGIVASIDNATDVTFTGVVSNGLVDVVASLPQFDTLALDQAATVSGSVATFANGVPPRLVVGSYLCAADTTPVCQAPLELHGLLALRVAYVTLKAKGDPSADALLEELNESKKEAMKLLEPRPEKPRSVINYNAPGWSRGYGRFGYGGGFR